MSRRALTVLVTVLGLALLAWQIDKIGLDHITDGLRRMGLSGLALILAASLVRQIARAISWTTLMRADARVPLGHALAATLAGDAIGNLTPLSLLVSEPTKAMLVGAHVRPPRALAALAAENFFYSISVAFAVLAGVAVLFLDYPVPDILRTASLVLVTGMAAVIVGALWLAWTQPALISTTLTALGAARLPAVARFATKVRELETSAYSFVRTQPSRLLIVAACEVTFHAFSIIETWITLMFLGQGSLALAFVLDTVQRVINVVFRIVPLKIGVDEVGSGLTSQALGYGSALGVTMGIVRKVRVLIWAGVGLIVLATRRPGVTSPDGLRAPSRR